MATRKLSPAARKAISQAARRRWAKYRAEKKKGGVMSYRKPGPKPGRKSKKGRRGRPPASAAGNQEMSSHSLEDLITMRRRIDQELADRLVRGQTD